VDVGHGGMDLTEAADMTEVAVMEALEIPGGIEVLEVVVMKVAAPEADIRKYRGEAS
jgi:hypothetical protein